MLATKVTAWPQRQRPRSQSALIVYSPQQEGAGLNRTTQNWYTLMRTVRREIPPRPPLRKGGEGGLSAGRVSKAMFHSHVD